MNGVVIVGASVAGVHAAEALRDAGFDRPVTLLSAETDLPYDRPPLSKSALRGEASKSQLLLRPEGWYQQHGIDLVLGRRARQLDPQRKSVLLDSGAELGYDGLILATGAAARSFEPVHGESADVYRLRTADDCARLRDRLVPGARVLVIGAGFLGLEVAATAHEIGGEVSIVELGPAPLAMALGVDVGQWFKRLHESHGVAVHCDNSVTAIDVRRDRSRAYLRDGGVIDADVVVAALGAVPMVQWLAGSGLELAGGGVRCDAYLRTSAADVVAAGDIAYWDNELYGSYMRVEHWTNAVEQGAFAARSLLGANERPYVGPPYFWTDQFAAKTRTVGYLDGVDAISIQRQDDHSLVALYGRGDVLRAAVCVNAPRSLLSCRRAITERAPWRAAIESLY
ncbi:MAG TPA: FAD-dependent oxidoreductase [Candidatus Saccharimonadales bacterium]|nr:FAD-dependent oxidoreductase [Candidatus Saccharimonadales bacterium]